MIKKYVPVDSFMVNRDWSSRVIHDMHGHQKPYDLFIAPKQLNFGRLTVNDLSSGQTATVLNTGYRPLPIRAITPVGEFLVSHDAPMVLEPGKHFTIHVVFSPKRNGFTSGGVYINTGNAAGDEFIEFHGTGTAGSGNGGGGTNPDPDPDPGTGTELPELSISDGVIVDVDDEATDLPLISISDGVIVEAEGEEPEDPDPSITHTLSISEGVIISEDGDEEEEEEPVIDPLKLTANPISLAFGLQPIGVKSAYKKITVYNANPSPVSIGDIVLPEGFEYSAISLPLVVPGQGSRSFDVCFLPTSKSSVTGGLTISFGEHGSRVITLSGTGAEVDPGEPLPLVGPLSTNGNRFVRQGTDQTVVLNSINWFGAEGGNYTPHGTWARPWKDILDQIKTLGFNSIRLPFSGEMLGKTPPPNAIDAILNPDLKNKTALEIFDMIVDYCAEIGLYVVLDHHRKWAGAGADGGPTDAAYTKTHWIQTWTTMAARYKDSPAVVGADVHNEPHDLKWPAWSALAKECGNAIHTVAPHWIIFVEGVGSSVNGGIHYWWGGYLADVRTAPITLALPNKLAYSPHEYGHSVGGQAWLSSGGHNVPNYPNNLYQVWLNNWSFIHYENIAPIWIGEMGGHFGVDGTGNLTKPNGPQEIQWMQELVKHIGGKETSNSNTNKNKMSFAWWSYNPNSGDTGGMVQDDWTTVQTVKHSLLTPLIG